MKRATRVAPILGVVLLSLTLAVLAGCGGGSGTDGGGGGSTPPVTGLTPPGAPALSIGETDPLPGVTLAVVGTSGGSGPGGNFRAGDFVTVQFTLKTDAGATLDLTLMDSGDAYLSGPTFNYNRVIPRQQDLRTASLYLGNATWQYTFPVPLPAVYAAPYNDTASFGAADGELTGQPLLDGTYSIGLETSKVYTLDGESHRDPGALVTDILVGGATVKSTHEEVTDAHCNQCHSDIRFHGDRRTGVRLCVLCHTSGSEDRNPATPGTSIDFRVMIHKIHQGKHLPSVLGMTTDASGNRVYAQTTTPLGVTTPYQLVGFSTTDASGFAFPVWPSLNVLMPKDYGFTALNTPATPAGAAKQAAENEFLKGVVSCSKCHGDPDGAGPIVAPIDGGLHESQPSRHACGSCHDDINWANPYAANNDIMPANPGTCNVCHPVSSTSAGVYPVRESHLHPVLNPLVNKDLIFNLTAVNEAGVAMVDHNNDGTIDPGEKLSLTFTLTEGDGVTPVLPSTVNSMSVIVAGPTSNYNLVLNSSVLGSHPDVQGAGPYTLKPAEIVLLERVGLDTGALGELFTTTRFRHLNLTGGTGNPQQTKVYTRTTVSAGPVDTGNGSSVAVGALGLMQNYIDVTPGQGVGFVANVAAGPAALVAGSPDAGTTAGNAIYATKYIVIEDGVGGPVPVGTPAFPPPPTVREEYNRIVWRQGDRLWLERPLRMSHAAGVSVKLCTLTQQTVTTHYTLNTTNGQITEVGNSFAGLPVIVTYTTDFMMPSLFPPPLNDAPDLDESWGEWKAKPIVKGTYTVDLYGYKDVVVTKFAVPGPAESQTYRGTSVAGNKDFLVIDDDNLATPGVDPYTVISAAENCYKCHNDLFFHGGGRRSFVTCLVCHGDSGAEDKPRYNTTNVVSGGVSTLAGMDTPKVTISFRQMLHKIHKGEELANAATYFVIGNSGSQNGYAEVVFPAWPAGVRECKKCHGNDAWHGPKDRTHPTPGVQILPTRVWRTVCGSCHDSNAAAAHIDVMTSPTGYESCETCHGAGKTDDVVKKHVVR